MGQKTSFIKGVIFEQGKNIVAMITSILYTYFVASLLGPSEYGIVIYYIGFSGSLLNLFGTTFLQNILTTFMPKWKSKNLFDTLIKLQFIIAIPLSITLWLFGQQIANFIEVGNGLLLVWTALLVILMPSYMSLSYLTKSFKNFGKSFKIESIMQILNLILAFGFIYFLKTGTIGIIWGQALSVSIATILGIYYYKKIPFKKQKIEWNEIKKFSISAFPSSTLKRAYNAFQIGMLGLFSNGIYLGYYYIIQKLVNLFTGITKGPMQNVITPYLIEKHNEKQTMTNFTSMTIKMSIIITTSISIMLILFGKILLDLFLPEFSNAYTLIPLFAILIISSSLTPIQSVFASINKMSYFLKTTIIAIIICTPISIILYPIFSVYAAPAIGTLYRLIIGVQLINYAKKEQINIEIIPRMKDFKFFITIIKNIFTKITSKN